MAAKVEIFQSIKNKEWHFRVKSNNGKIIAQSEGYKRKCGAENGYDSLLKALRYCDLAPLPVYLK